ncbi:MAG TPA: serine--tRNA ligase [Nitrososphaeraceae archaeon]|jgi:seryl-tRNA synthetase|nr:serine--tRNA ligase [Nitrososphaeraceae archaeon]
MIDLKLLKENPQVIEDMLKKRKLDFPIKDLLTLDKMRRRIVIEMQEAKHKKNILANTIATKKKNKNDIAGELEEMNKIGDKIIDLEREKAVIEPKFRHLLMMVPNIIHESVPIGNDETDNVIIKQNGTPRKHSFNPKDHVDIATSLDLVDIERAAKISGARFYFLKNDLVRMNQALIHFSLDFLSKKGYVVVQPPFMIRKHAMEGAVILGDFQEVIYKVEGEDLYMIGTSEHALAAMHMDEILEGKNLPIRYGGISPCFRKEAGAHGKDMKGIFRVHQFEKVEQFIYSRPEDSWKEHERMLSLTEEFYEKLGVPYRVVLLCSADLGKVSSKTYDIEGWMPSQNTYREIVSCSNDIDYQARRLSIRFRDKTSDETRLVHTLNSTLVATERTMVIIMENYQTAKGTVEIPEILQKYMNDIKEIQPVPR